MADTTKKVGTREKVYPNFGAKVRFSNFGVGVDGLASVTLNIPDQDFSPKDLQAFIHDLTALSGDLRRAEAATHKANAN